MCTYVDTRLSLPSLKYTVVAWLLTCLHLSTSGDPAFDFTRGHSLTTQHVISTHVHVFENKTTHVERQRVLPTFAHAPSCTRLPSTSRPHSFCEHPKWRQKTKTMGTSTWPTWHSISLTSGPTTRTPGFARSRGSSESATSDSLQRNRITCSQPCPQTSAAASTTAWRR